MKTISVLGLVFLPGTFICVPPPPFLPLLLLLSQTNETTKSLFSTTFFNFSPGSDTTPQQWVMSSEFWIYFAVAVPVTLLTIACWFVWTKHSMRLATRNGESAAPLVRKPTIYEKKAREGVTFPS